MTTMSSVRYDLVALTALGGATAAGYAVRDRLPARIATHFDLRGVPNDFMARDHALLIVPAIGFGTWALVRFLPRVLPRSERARMGESNLALSAALLAVFVSFMHLVVLARAFDAGFSVNRAVWLGLGVLLVALGLVLPRVGRNAILGVRTAWTLASDENWARTHRVAGYTFVVGGAAIGLLGLIGGVGATVLAVVVLLATTAVPVVYSLVLARKLDAG